MTGRVVHYRNDKDLNFRALVVKAKDDGETPDLDLIVVYPDGKVEKPTGVPHLSKLLEITEETDPDNKPITIRRRKPGAHWRY